MGEVGEAAGRSRVQSACVLKLQPDRTPPLPAAYSTGSGSRSIASGEYRRYVSLWIELTQSISCCVLYAAGGNRVN